MPEPKTKPKVLVVDDERVIADTLSMILNQSGFEARAVYSGEGALELAQSFAPDMLISDVINGGFEWDRWRPSAFAGCCRTFKILLFSADKLPRPICLR